MSRAHDKSIKKRTYTALYIKRENDYCGKAIIFSADGVCKLVPLALTPKNSKRYERG